MAIFDKLADEVKDGKIVEVKVKRENAMRGRIRIKAPDGEDLIIDMPRGRIINNCDTFGPSHDNTYYKVMVEPELVIKVTVEKSGAPKDMENAIKLGYNLGNRHLEVLIESDAAYVPVTLGEDKIREILKRTALPLKLESVQKIVMTTAPGYHAGEEEES